MPNKYNLTNKIYLIIDLCNKNISLISVNLFSCLKKINSFEFSSLAQNHSKTCWNGKGWGSVVCESIDNSLHFREQGFFQLNISQKPNKMDNEYIWRQINSNRINLSHARFGYDNIVNLFDLIPINEKHWVSENNHKCAEDLYSSDLYILDKHIKIIWRISGPKKSETIKYIYRMKD